MPARDDASTLRRESFESSLRARATAAIRARRRTVGVPIIPGRFARVTHSTARRVLAFVSPSIAFVHRPPRVAMRRDASRCVASPTSIFGASPPRRRARGKRARNNERATSFDAAVTAPRVDDRLARASTTTRRDRRGVARRSTVPRARRV
jgi:hypothetical protein